jgi:hypothetical protein
MPYIKKKTPYDKWHTLFELVNINEILYNLYQYHSPPKICHYKVEVKK